MALALNVDSVDRISKLQHETLIIHQTNEGLNSTCSFTLLDQCVIQTDVWTVETTRVEDGDTITTYVTFNPTAKVEVSVVDGATTYFAGILSRVEAHHVGGRARYYVCDCHDFNALLEESVVDDLEEYTAKTDGFIVDAIFDDYVTGIDYATHVDPSGDTLDNVSFENITVRQVLDIIASRTGCVWYVDYSKKLHYSLVEANAPAWHLSDNPDDVNSFSYDDDIKRGKDATNLVNQVLVIGSEGATWYTDAASVATYGAHKAVVRDFKLIDADDIEARGDAVLDKFKDPVITYTVTITKTGLRAGMHVRLVNALYDVDDTFLVSRVSVTFPVTGEPRFRVVCGGITSSLSGSARRLAQDKLDDASAPILPSQLPLASRGWGHDLTFSATDNDTVAWGAGTLTTASGSTFAIAAGNTDDPGAMAAKTIIYLDTSISLTALQMTTDETAALGLYRIMVAVAWPGAATAEAGFQVFGTSAEVQTYLNAHNIVADCITANEIFGNTLSVIAANMGTLTSGIIQTAAAGNNRVVLDTTFGIKGISAANVTQFHLSITDGKVYCGGTDVVLDADGVTLVAGSGATNFIKWDDNGNTIGRLYADWAGGAGDDVHLFLMALEAGVGGDEAKVSMAALKGAADIRLTISSSGTLAFYTNRLTVDASGNVEALARLIGDTIETDSGEKWNLGGANSGTITPDTKVHVEIDGSWYTLAAEAGLV